MVIGAGFALGGLRPIAKAGLWPSSRGLLQSRCTASSPASSSADRQQHCSLIATLLFLKRWRVAAAALVPDRPPHTRVGDAYDRRSGLGEVTFYFPARCASQRRGSTEPPVTCSLLISCLAAPYSISAITRPRQPGMHSSIHLVSAAITSAGRSASSGSGELGPREVWPSSVVSPGVTADLRSVGVDAAIA